MSTLFFTGFPGFLGSSLLPRVLARDAGSRAVCLIQAKFAEASQHKIDQIVAEQPELAGRIELVEGDITAPDLGLGEAQELRQSVREIYHLAAVYDLSVPRRVGMRVNVDGTHHMLDFAEKCPALTRFHYVSTCYVSGTYPGIFGEEDLEKGQEFNNFYEETKYLAEVEVQRRMEEGLPATIYRPPIVVGDSRTGATQKYDGPYFVMRWLLRQPAIAFMPMVGDPNLTRVNLAPSNFVIDAMTYLSGLEISTGKVYQLADPSPLTVDELTRVIAEATRRKVVRIPLPKIVAKAAINYVPGVYRVMQIPAASVDYFVHPTHYTSFQTQADLAGSGISCPPFASYVDRLVKFVQQHPEIDGKAMV